MYKRQAPASAITLTDQAGRQVELDAPADTLVSCYYVTTYATMALGISDRVVGLEKKADTRPIYAMAAPDLLEKEQVGTMKELDLEAVAALEPDLVVMPKKLMDYAAPLEELGIPVLVVNPESHEALTGMLELLGQACGVEDRAQALTDYYEEQLADVYKRQQQDGRPQGEPFPSLLSHRSSPLSAASGPFLLGDERRVDLKSVEGLVKVLDVGGKGVEGIGVPVENAGHPKGAQDAGGNGGVPLLNAAWHLIDRTGPVSYTHLR